MLETVVVEVVEGVLVVVGVLDDPGGVSEGVLTLAEEVLGSDLTAVGVATRELVAELAID